MNATVLAKQCGLDNYQWLTLGASADSVQCGDSEALVQSCLPDSHLVLIASTQDTSLRKVAFEAHEKKMLRKTIPYSLEDDLLDDVDDLHFALGEIQEQAIVVAWIKKTQLEQRLSHFQEQGVDVQLILPELPLLPCEEKSWTLLIDDERWIVKSDNNQGFSLEVANAGLALQLLLDEAEELPESLVVYQGGSEQSFILSHLPELLRGIVEWRDAGYWQVIAVACQEDFSPHAKRLNLLQGDYERKLPWKQWWLTWRIAAIFWYQ
ncbi:MAG: hypothetical protein JKY66_01985 [Spongiibacteraceae bacterium]|nr:hypothetical protein [Spongiibacteraceae bacterium]